MDIAKWIIAVLVFYLIVFILLPILALPTAILTAIKVILVLGAIIWCLKQL